jgi:hypothetical protein
MSLEALVGVRFPSLFDYHAQAQIFIF